MKRRRILLLLALAVVAMGIVLFWLRGPKEPVYQGKKLTEWTQEALKFEASTESEQARKVIRSIGTNALPWLISELTRSRPKLRTTFNHWATDRLPEALRFAEDYENRIDVATAALCCLGTAAAPALPALAARLADEDAGPRLAETMSFCGEPAVPYLRAAMDSSNPKVVSAAVRGLSNLAKTNDALIPPIIALTSHTNADVRYWAVFSLGHAGSQPEVIVPTLTRVLSDATADVRIAAAFQLRKFGTNANPALPELRRMMTNSNPSVAAAASNAVYRIDHPFPQRPVNDSK